MAMVCTFFEAFNVPVFWPILVMYFIMLFCITMKRQIKVGTARPGGAGAGRVWEGDAGLPRPPAQGVSGRKLCTGPGGALGAPLLSTRPASTAVPPPRVRERALGVL